MATPPRPVFVYGTLQALPLLAWAITGETKIDTITGMIQRGTVRGYRRYSLHNRDYPAAIKDDNSFIDGYLVSFQTASQRRKIDDFEGECYKAAPVTVSVENDGEPRGESVEADLYVWDGNMDAISSEPWDLEEFIRTRLDDWIDLFVGMELVGDDDL